MLCSRSRRTDLISGEKQKSAKANTVSLNLTFSGCRSNIEPELVGLGPCSSRPSPIRSMSEATLTV